MKGGIFEEHALHVLVVVNFSSVALMAAFHTASKKDSDELIASNHISLTIERYRFGILLISIYSSTVFAAIYNSREKFISTNGSAKVEVPVLGTELPEHPNSAVHPKLTGTSGLYRHFSPLFCCTMFLKPPYFSFGRYDVTVSSNVSYSLTVLKSNSRPMS